MLSSSTLSFLVTCFEKLTSIGRFKLLEALALTNSLSLYSLFGENDSNPLLVSTKKTV